ncbi:MULTISPECIES: hypothetical protein [Azospira]|uniref:hypothetical protein n=1 Tax=Azospira TaxID=146937 RepID=UPI0012A22C01|nr:MULTISPECIES: hypothetical protein [Azospira]BBN88105.1 hypothetical protein AZSP09_11280 [Azospira sp. I09]
MPPFSRALCKLEDAVIKKRIAAVSTAGLLAGGALADEAGSGAGAEAGEVRVTRIGAQASVAGPVQTIRAGDTVWIPPGVKHWHGAAPTTAMSHIAIAESLDGKVVDWLEQVSKAQYEVLPDALLAVQ